MFCLGNKKTNFQLRTLIGRPVHSLQIENISNHLWKKHEPTIAKMQNSFASKISKLSQKFQEKIIKQTEHWFEKASKRNEKKKGKTTHKDKPSPKKPHVKNGKTKRRSHINLEGIYYKRET